MEMTTSVASAREEHIAGCVLILQILINGKFPPPNVNSSLKGLSSEVS